MLLFVISFASVCITEVLCHIPNIENVVVGDVVFRFVTVILHAPLVTLSAHSPLFISLSDA